MRLQWTRAAVSDLTRLHDFLKPVNENAATRVVQMLTAAPRRLLQYPRIGERLDEFAPREVRRIIVGHHELRYELAGEVIHVLRIWHTREER
jgi:Plasmid stabilization system protein